ncbi:hypothetical protein WJX72_007658 [[Myrmecia] bisecta]|uniref:Ubiquinone biosynthesis monooxygenase COQ6, mitochondrial n=1 Tax=[Myrmecia] bisecta TaxID=41462 RepID=A0AAW1Q9P2_9CHLO
MVGAAVAAALSANRMTSQLRVALVDRQAPASTFKPPPVPELRVSTVTPATIDVLRRIGAWEDLQPPRSAAFATMQVWDYGGNSFVRYNAADAGADTLGHVVENNVLLVALLRLLRPPHANVDTFWPASVRSLKLPDYSKAAGWNPLAEVQLDSGQTLHARLVVGADGGRSHIRSLAGLRTTGWSYNQRGVVGTVRTQTPNQVAWQRFLPSGPLALLPVRDGYSNVVWSTTPQHARQLEAASPAGFAAAVNEALSGGPRPAQSSLVTSLLSSQPRPDATFLEPPTVEEAPGPSARSFPLTLCHAGRYVRPRLALVGDAAHAIHPLAGQGVNLGFGDVQALVDTLADAVSCGTDLGDILLLEGQYERPRQRANTAMMAAIDSLKHVFTPQSGPLASLRGLGLDVVNLTPAVKGRILSYAMGA